MNTFYHVCDRDAVNVSIGLKIKNNQAEYILFVPLYFMLRKTFIVINIIV